MYNLEKAYNVTNIQKSNISLQMLFYVVSPLTTGMFSKSDIFLKKPNYGFNFIGKTNFMSTKYINLGRVYVTGHHLRGLRPPKISVWNTDIKALL